MFSYFINSNAPSQPIVCEQLEMFVINNWIFLPRVEKVRIKEE